MLILLEIQGGLQPHRPRSLPPLLAAAQGAASVSASQIVFLFNSGGYAGILKVPVNANMIRPVAMTDAAP
jgi:hypothetical protein